ncbi:MAG: hypothetical protein HOP11_01770 [Saprospiraceae bacterium]|nr:hypothetical protein [Saprospiraceae bacterium]
MKNVILFSFCLLIISSCVDRNFDVPPVKELEIPFSATHGIDYLNSKYVPGKFTEITEDIKIVATVIADDRSGNFYKSLVVQDSTGGILLKINRNGLFSSYPQNSKVGILCKGLTIGDYGGLIQLGKGSSVSNGREQLDFIPDNQVASILYPGPRNKPVIPAKRTINSVRTTDLSTLIELENVEFKRSDVGKSIGNLGAGSFVDLSIVDCNNAAILLHTSDFSDFATYKAPDKNGSIIAVLGKFNSSIQLYLRDTSEIRFSNTPCNSSGGNSSLVTIQSIRTIYSGVSTNIKGNSKIRGVVISDKDSKNVNSQNLFIQDASAGITIRFTGAHNFALNEELEIDLIGLELSEFKGLLQINSVPISNAKVVPASIALTPKLMNISELTTNFELHESSLILIKNVKLSKASDGKYSFDVTATDNTGSINLFTNPNSVFANDNFPVNNVDLVVIASEFDSKQILIRNLKDVTDNTGGGGGGGTTVETIREIRSLFTGAVLNISDDFIVRGTVISDKSALNIVSQNLFLQDATAGIAVRFAGSHTFNIGDIIEVKVKGVELSEFSGLLQLNNTPLANATLISTRNTLSPQIMSIKSIVDNVDQLEGQLIQIDNVTISKTSGNTYSGACILTDATGTIELFTRSQSNFATTTISVTPVKIVGIVSYFNKAQVVVRNINDIKP